MVTKSSRSGTWSLYGSEDSQLVVAGHSHAAAILEAKLGDQDSGTLREINVCYTSDLAAGPPGDEEYWNFVAKMAQYKDLVIIWNGNQHNANFLFQTSPPFALVQANSNERSAERSNDYRLISQSMMEAFFQPSFSELKPIVESITGARSVSLLPGPAPKPHSHIVSRIANEEFFVGVANSLGVNISDLTITSDSLRVQMWQILVDQLKQTARDLGVNFIPVPEETIDENGLLLEVFWTPDVTHANNAYGIAVANHILKSVSGGK